MSQINTDASDLHPIFHPAAHYDSPTDILHDTELSAREKRIILSSWASDMYAVESCPGLREIPGMGHAIRLADILAALRQLDGGNDDEPPRGGGVPMRLRRPSLAAARKVAGDDDPTHCGTRVARSRVGRMGHSVLVLQSAMQPSGAAPSNYSSSERLRTRA